MREFVSCTSDLPGERSVTVVARWNRSIRRTAIATARRSSHRASDIRGYCSIREIELPTRTESTHQVTQIEMIVETSHADFARAFESLLKRMPIEAFDELASLSPDAARERLASFVGPLSFVLFQKIDHGSIVTALTGRRCEATTYVFGNALIASE